MMSMNNCCVSAFGMQRGLKMGFKHLLSNKHSFRCFVVYNESTRIVLLFTIDWRVSGNWNSHFSLESTSIFTQSSSTDFSLQSIIRNVYSNSICVHYCDRDAAAAAVAANWRGKFSTSKISIVYSLYSVQVYIQMSRLCENHFLKQD